MLTALRGTPWRREFEAVAPRDRRTFTELATGWAAAIANRASKVLTGE
jgi:hypothetical protein